MDLVHETVQDVNKRLIEAKTREVLTQVSEDPELQASMQSGEEYKVKITTTASTMTNVSIILSPLRAWYPRVCCYTRC